MKLTDISPEDPDDILFQRPEADDDILFQQPDNPGTQASHQMDTGAANPVEKLKENLYKQCARGMWDFPEERLDEIYGMIDAVQDEQGALDWKNWMNTTFPNEFQ